MVCKKISLLQAWFLYPFSPPHNFLVLGLDFYLQDSNDLSILISSLLQYSAIVDENRKSPEILDITRLPRDLLQFSR